MTPLSETLVPSNDLGEIEVLIVDDDPSDAETSGMALRQAGMRAHVVTAVDERQLLDALKAAAPDIVLCDFTFLGFDGFAAIGLIRSLRPGIPVIFVAGTITEERATIAIQGGAAGYVAKSNLQLLPYAVRTAVAAARGQRALDEKVSEANARVQAQVKRFEALWRISTQPDVGDTALIDAKLREARDSLIPGQPFRAVLSRIEGPAFVVQAVSDPAAGVEPMTRIAKGQRCPIAGGIMAQPESTRYADDLAADPLQSPAFAAMGVRAIIATKFSVGEQIYVLSCVSAERARRPFGIEDAAYIELLAASLAKQLEIERLADSLRLEKERTRDHGERLEGLLKIVNDVSLRDAEMWLVMLEHAVATIVHGQRFRGVLSRVEGETLIQETVVDIPPSDGTTSVLAERKQIPLAGSVAGRIVADGGRTQFWNCIDESANMPFAVAKGWRSGIGTSFFAGGAVWTLSLLAREPARQPFELQDIAYIELIGSFFANQLQQHWQFERLRYHQEHDNLTGLLNRSQFRSRSRAAASQNKRFAIVKFDLSGFREINEAYGHMIGDAMLVEVGNALKRASVDGELVGRVSGDVFGVYLPDAGSKDDVRARAMGLAEIFAHPFSTGDRDGKEFIALTASIGIAVAPDDGATVDAIMSHADAALATTKRAGQGAVLFYSAGMEGDAQFHAILRTEIQTALNEDQFELFFQPHVDLASGAVLGCEALIRWNHPEKGLLLPATFIPFAESSGMIAGIDAWVMKHAFVAATEMSALQPDFRLYFNLSGRQAGSPDLVQAFVDAAAAGVRLENIGVEITESDAMRNVDETRRVCEGLRKLGVRIAMDDFGTGYSSLSMLKLLPIDSVKIDRSFVSGVLNDSADVAIAEAIISISKSFGFDSLAEGAETVEQIDWLRAAACRHVQGYAICHPLPMDEFKSWFTERTTGNDAQRT